MLGQLKFALLGLLGLAFATWVVSLAGIASLQSHCGDDVSLPFTTSSGFTSCSKALRYDWFIVWFQFFVILVAGAAVATGSGRKGLKGRTAAVGLLSVTALLYIWATNTYFIYNDNLGDLDKWGTQIKVSMAGFLMTAAVDLLMILALGWEHTDEVEAPRRTEAKAAAAGEAAV